MNIIFDNFLYEDACSTSKELLSTFTRTGMDERTLCVTVQNSSNCLSTLTK